MIAPITRIGRNSSASDICCAFGSARRTAGHCRQSSLTDTAAVRSETEGVSCCGVFRWSRRWKPAEGARPGGMTDGRLCADRTRHKPATLNSASRREILEPSGASALSRTTSPPRAGYSNPATTNGHEVTLCLAKLRGSDCKDLARFYFNELGELAAIAIERVRGWHPWARQID